MKPPKLTLDQIRELGDPIYKTLIPDSWADTNGHVNVRWYAVLYDDAGDVLHDMHALTLESHRARNSGTMDLEHHTHFISEVMPGETVSVYVRALAVNAKRLHYLMFVVNESQNRLASIFECINSFVDLNVRKTAPWPEATRLLMDEMIAAHSKASWPAPVTGAMSV
ncbi:MAG TPA: thioesterase family protein [Bryobacteraceae bacterium]|nr:thioesterase family protein [Bryobacteraceae bacterium]